MKLNIQLFASGTITFATDEKLQGKIEWSSVSNGSEANTSTVTTKLYAHRTDSYTTKGASWKGNVKVGSNAAHSFGGFSSSKTIGSSWVLFATYTDTVTHNADGTMTVNISGWVNGPSGTSLSGARSSGNADVVLDTIPRASQPSLSSSTATMGSPVTIYTNRASDSFVHTIRYAFGNASGTIASNVTTSTSWTPSLDLAYQITTAQSGGGAIYCDTYSGGTLIGTKAVGITIKIPSTMKPTINTPTYSEANSTMISLNWGVYVKNKSQLRIRTSGSGTYGSSISKYTIQINQGTTYETNDHTTGIITTDSLRVDAKVIDSRGVSSNNSMISVSMVDYVNPQITQATATRCDANGNESDEGTYLKYSFVGSISPVSNHNGHTFRIGYRVKDTGNYTYVNVNTTDYSINLTNQVLNLNLSTESSYDIRFEANDTFTSTPINRQVDSGFDLMNFNASGKSMAIGKVSEATGNEELFEVGIPTDHKNTLTVTTNGIYNQLENSYGFAHYTTDGANGHWFNTDVKVQGNVYGGTGYNRQLAYKDETMPKTIFTSNFNNYIYNNFGSVDGISTNNPNQDGSSFYGTMIVQQLGQMDYGSQIAVNVNTGLAYSRYKLNGTWKDWVGLNHTRKLTFANEWRMAFNPYGAGWRMNIPFYSPYGTRPTLSLTSCEYFGNAGWKSCTASINYQSETECMLVFSGITDSETRGYMVLIRMAGTLKL